MMSIRRIAERMTNPPLSERWVPYVQREPTYDPPPYPQPDLKYVGSQFRTINWEGEEEIGYGVEVIGNPLDPNSQGDYHFYVDSDTGNYHRVFTRRRSALRLMNLIDRGVPIDFRVGWGRMRDYDPGDD